MLDACLRHEPGVHGRTLPALMFVTLVPGRFCIEGVSVVGERIVGVFGFKLFPVQSVMHRVFAQLQLLKILRFDGAEKFVGYGLMM